MSADDVRQRRARFDEIASFDHFDANAPHLRESEASRARASPLRGPRTPTPQLSVIVPAYRDRESIIENIEWLCAALQVTDLTWEIVVVVDGDLDTYRHAVRVASDQVHVYGYQANRGKGFALRYGMSLSEGNLVTFIDSDMDIGPEEIGRMARLLHLYNADVVVGSKRHPLSVVQYPAFRRLQSALYQLLVRALFRVKVRDTQTGLKMMRRDVALKILNVALVKRFAFDLELLALAVHFGHTRIIEAPVTIRYRFRTTTNIRAVLYVLRDTAAIFYRLRIRHWYDRCEASGMASLMASLPAPFPQPVDPPGCSESVVGRAAPGRDQPIAPAGSNGAV